jgi:hypothetical protein
VTILKASISLTYFDGGACLDPKHGMALVFSRTDAGIMIMARFERLRFAAIVTIAGATIVSTTASGWAFTQQTVMPGGNGNYDFNYTDPNHPATTGQSALPSDSTGSGFHFTVEPSPTSPFSGSGFQSGNRSFGNGGDPTSPGYYILPGK